MDTTQNVQHYAKVFQDALAIVKDEQAAAFIVEQIGKDSRMAAMQARLDTGASASNGNGHGYAIRDPEAPATDSQRWKLKQLGVSFSKDVTKGEASALIDAASK